MWGESRGGWGTFSRNQCFSHLCAAEAAAAASKMLLTTDGTGRFFPSTALGFKCCHFLGFSIARSVSRHGRRRTAEGHQKPSSTLGEDAGSSAGCQEPSLIVQSREEDPHALYILFIYWISFLVTVWNTAKFCVCRRHSPLSIPGKTCRCSINGQSFHQSFEYQLKDFLGFSCKNAQKPTTSCQEAWSGIQLVHVGHDLVVIRVEQSRGQINEPPHPLALGSQH